MEADSFHTLQTTHGVSTQHLERKDDCLLQGLGLSFEVEDVDSGVVAGRSHQGVLGVIADSGHAFLVEDHRLVRLGAEIQIVTKQLNKGK